MIALAYIVFGLGCILWFAGDLRFLVAAHRQGAFWFFGCLFIPPVGLLFLALHFKEAWRPTLISMLGFAIAGLGYWAGGFSFLV